jgi:hypothetical protein
MPNALVIGTDHAFQRHQDLSAVNAAKRTAYTEFLSTSLEARNVDALAEEAGDDQEVWECLKSQELGITAELRALFAGTEIVNGPQPTIARSLTNSRGVRYGDVRAKDAHDMTIFERDEYIAHETHRLFGDAHSVLVVVGEQHRAEVARILSENYGWTTDVASFL